jgi:hypothetical protein
MSKGTWVYKQGTGVLKAIPTTSNVKKQYMEHGSDFVNYGMGNVDLITCAVDTDGYCAHQYIDSQKKKPRRPWPEEGWRI